MNSRGGVWIAVTADRLKPLYAVGLPQCMFLDHHIISLLAIDLLDEFLCLGQVKAEKAVAVICHGMSSLSKKERERKYPS